jgi:quaternary ammonium compound-resistance protein SugE
MAWVYLVLAGICEIVWAIGLKYSNGFTRFWPSVWTIAIMLLSFVLLSQAMRTLPLGTAYAMWTGIGAVGTAIYGMIYFNESRDWPRLICIALVIVGIVGLKFLSPKQI